MANEKRLIDANALLRKKYEIYEPEDPEQCGSHPYTHKVVGVEDVKNAPTVDAVEASYGHWIELKSMAPEYSCSECGRSYEWWEVSEAHYCPNCGAKMDGGQKNV